MYSYDQSTPFILGAHGFTKKSNARRIIVRKPHVSRSTSETHKQHH